MFTCGTCGHEWDYDTPASRCPMEYDHPEPEPERGITITDSDSGTVYHPFINPETGVVGYRCEHHDGNVEFITLNPSTGSDDGLPTVFVYLGATGDPAQDAAFTHYVMNDD